MEPNVTVIYTALEVCHSFMELYHKACQAKYQKTNDVEQEKIHNENFDRMFYMLEQLEMAKMLELPEHYLVEFDPYSVVMDILMNDNFPKLLTSVVYVQEEAQRYRSKINTVVYSRGNAGGLCQRRYSVKAEKIHLGVTTFLDNTTFIIKEMNDEATRKEMLEELKQYL
jgi:hypothetical protein